MLKTGSQTNKYIHQRQEILSSWFSRARKWGKTSCPDSILALWSTGYKYLQFKTKLREEQTQLCHLFSLIRKKSATS